MDKDKLKELLKNISEILSEFTKELPEDKEDLHWGTLSEPIKDCRTCNGTGWISSCDDGSRPGFWSDAETHAPCECLMAERGSTRLVYRKGCIQCRGTGNLKGTNMKCSCCYAGKKWSKYI